MLSPLGGLRGGTTVVTSPSVMKEISEPRGCVCGVLPEQGPAARTMLSVSLHCLTRCRLHPGTASTACRQGDQAKQEQLYQGVAA